MGTSVGLFVVIATVLVLLTLAVVLRPLWRERPAPAP